MIETILAAAVQAPNHYKVRPWRFIVLTGEARARLGDRMGQALHQKNPDASNDLLTRERAKPLRAPVVVAVGVDKPAVAQAVELENVCAVAAAVQNMLLAAHALGLGAMWRTGSAARDPDVKTFLGLAPDQHLIGFVYIGYPENGPTPSQRPSYEDRTVWMEE